MEFTVVDMEIQS